MKNIFFMGLALMATIGIWTACNNNASKSEAQADHAHIYTCPMHPEIVSDHAGKCPKCNMDLEAKHPETHTNQYKMHFSAPTEATAGAEVTLSFTPEIKGGEPTAVPLDVQHEKKIHLIVVSDDLSWFTHIHPEYQSDGSYTVRTTFPHGGTFTLFADYKPTGAERQLETLSLSIQGKPVPAKTWPKPKTTTTTIDGYLVSLESEIGKFVDKGETHIAVKVEKGGKEIKATQLENYLGDKGHAVMVSADGEKRYLHIHPGVEADRLHLTASFGKPGVYRGWLQFQHEGKVQTADFVLNVVEGKGEMPADAHSHEGHSH